MNNNSIGTWKIGRAVRELLIWGFVRQTFGDLRALPPPRGSPLRLWPGAPAPGWKKRRQHGNLDFMLEPLRMGTLAALLAAAPARSAEGPPVRVEFVVRVPEGTPPGETLYLAGNARSLGGWSPKGFPLTRLPDGRFTARV